MERSEIESKVLAIIKDKMGLSEPPKPDQLFEDIGMDSLDQVENLMGVEDEFDLEIPDSAAERMKTPKDMIDYVVSTNP